MIIWYLIKSCPLITFDLLAMLMVAVTSAQPRALNVVKQLVFESWL